MNAKEIKTELERIADAVTATADAVTDKWDELSLEDAKRFALALDELGRGSNRLRPSRLSNGAFRPSYVAGETAYNVARARGRADVADRAGALDEAAKDYLAGLDAAAFRRIFDYVLATGDDVPTGPAVEAPAVNLDPAEAAKHPTEVEAYSAAVADLFNRFDSAAPDPVIDEAYVRVALAETAGVISAKSRDPLAEDEARRALRDLADGLRRRSDVFR